ncbi:ATP-grasp domain-containing protein [Clostridium gasigenes]|uniref:ATP-grasp domain-containing protein n=1 Tax=Clostridium gasigenes TaxID=94869 RepID=UPI001C0AA847|nr:ATP-grasp domain-containing protein [Clostridium gasigenes]MBU3107645.1 ATP-grasp domain-containing protein [Clostridium gasigenes]
MKDRIVIIGASELQLPLIEKAKSKGYETHVFAWKAGENGERVADKFYPISITEKELICDVCKEINPKGIVSIASDLAVVTVNYIADKLGLVGNSEYSTIVSTNKYEMRKALRLSNVNCPRFIKVKSEQECDCIGLTYPLIVKPVDRSGSRGIYKVLNNTQLKLAVINSLEQSFIKEVIVEEFIIGKEYSVEYISINGKHKFLALTEKVTTGAPNFIEVGHIQPANINKDILESIKINVEMSLDALDIKVGASHSEVLINEIDEVFIVEIGARMGGDCIGSDLVEISTGNDFVGMVIDVACGSDISIKSFNEPRIGIVRYIFDNDDYELLQVLKKTNKEHIWRVSELTKIENKKIRDSSQRQGFFILNVPTNDRNISIFNNIDRFRD